MRTQKSEAARRQRPLVEAYRRDPEQAISVKHVRTLETPATDAWHGTVTTVDYPGAPIAYGIDAKVGGDDDLPNPGHILVAALAACLESTTRIVADHQGVGIAHLEVDVVGDVDLRGSLAVTREVRAGFRGIRAEITLRPEPGTDPGRVERVLRAVDRLCITLETLRNGVPVEVSTTVETP